MCGLQEQETCMPVCHCPCSPSRLPHLTQCFSVTHSFKTTDKKKLAFLLRDRTSQRGYSCFFFHLNLLLLLEEHTLYFVWRDHYCSFEESQVSWRTLSARQSKNGHPISEQVWPWWAFFLGTWPGQFCDTWLPIYSLWLGLTFSSLCNFDKTKKHWCVSLNKFI